MKYFAGLILSLISFGAVAEAIPLPSCTINNQPVRYQSFKAENLNAYDLQTWVAASGTQNGHHIISYNSTLLSSKPKEWSLQVMLHECGHLKMHINKPNPPYHHKEYQADCYSANALRDEYDYTPEQFEIIATTMAGILTKNRINDFLACSRR